jgi:hypothetical protein
LRWLVLRLSAAALLGIVLAGLVLLSAVLALVHLLALRTSAGMAGRFHSPAAAARLVLVTLRSVLGTDTFPRQPGNIADDLIATAASLASVLVPALILGVVFIRIFSGPVFIWRRCINICRLDQGPPLGPEMAARDPGEALIAVRFYKRIRHLTVNELRCRAYLRMRETSPVDGSHVFRSVPLRLLDADGSLATERLWHVTSDPMPFTAWIPVLAPARRRALTGIQGRDIAPGTGERDLVIVVTGKIAALGTEFFDEHSYRLADAEIQYGRYAPVDLAADAAPESLRGWTRFEEPLRTAIFLYDARAHPQHLRALLGHEVTYGADVVAARLLGYRRRWRCAAATPDHSLAPLSDPPGPVPDLATAPADRPADGTAAGSLLLTIEPAPRQHVRGLLAILGETSRTTLERLAGDEYTLIPVTDRVDHACMPSIDVVWAYTATPAARQAADRALASGTAVISQHYLTRTHAAVAAGGPDLAQALDDDGTPDGVTIR